MSEQVEYPKTADEVKCPYCGNPVNWKKFSHWIHNTACFVAECWSGDPHKDMPRHIFKIFVLVDKEVVVGQEERQEGE